MDEIAGYDLPAAFKLISMKTGSRKSIIYVGHSMGTTLSYLYASSDEEHRDGYLKGLISLAPVETLQNMRGLFKSTVEQMLIYKVKQISCRFATGGGSVVGPLFGTHAIFNENYSIILI